MPPWTSSSFSSSSASKRRQQLPHLATTENNNNNTTAAATTRLTPNDVDEIDDWLTRLERLQGALPAKQALPSPSLSISSNTRERSDDHLLRQHHLRSPTDSGISNSSSQSSSQQQQHYRRRSLAYFTSSGYSTPLSAQSRSPSPTPTPSSTSPPTIADQARGNSSTTNHNHNHNHQSLRINSTANTIISSSSSSTIVSPRPSSQLEPDERQLYTSGGNNNNNNNNSNFGKFDHAPFSLLSPRQRRPRASSLLETSAPISSPSSRFFVADGPSASTTIAIPTTYSSQAESTHIDVEHSISDESIEENSYILLTKVDKSAAAGGLEGGGTQLVPQEDSRPCTPTQDSISSFQRYKERSTSSSIPIHSTDTSIEMSGNILGEASELSNDTISTSNTTSTSAAAAATPFIASSSSSRSIKSFSTTSTSSKRSKSKSANNNDNNTKLQPRSPFSSPKQVLASRASRKNLLFERVKHSDEDDDDDDEYDDEKHDEKQKDRETEEGRGSHYGHVVVGDISGSPGGKVQGDFITTSQALIDDAQRLPGPNLNAITSTSHNTNIITNIDKNTNFQVSSLTRRKKLSKTSFTSSSASSIRNGKGGHVHGRKESIDSKGSASSIHSISPPTSSHNHNHHHHHHHFSHPLSFFGRNTAKHIMPVTQKGAAGSSSSSSKVRGNDEVLEISSAGLLASPVLSPLATTSANSFGMTSTSSLSGALPRLVPREERMPTLPRSNRQRSKSSRSISSLQLDDEHVTRLASGTTVPASDDDDDNGNHRDEKYKNDDDDDDDDVISTLNPRRASISSSSLAYHRSKDDRRTLASSINRISLAVPPPLTRSYSYDGQVSSAMLANYEAAAGGAEAIRLIPDMTVDVFCWFAENSRTGATAPPAAAVASVYAVQGGVGHIGTSLSTLASTSKPTFSHTPSNAAKGLANVIFSNVPGTKKKVVRRESIQGLTFDLNHQEGEGNNHAIDDWTHDQVHGSGGGDDTGNKNRKKSKDKDHSTGLSSGAKSKGKERQKDKLSILLPAGQWKPCQLTLKANGQLNVTHGKFILTAISMNTLQRTDIRLVDPSLLGRQRCIAIHVKGGSYLPLPSPKPAPLSFPMSPSAPDFNAASGSSRPATAGFDRHRVQDIQTLFFAFPTAASQHAWMASLLGHALPEIYPASAALLRSRVTFAEDGTVSESEDSPPQSPGRRRLFSQAPKWRQGERNGGVPSSEQPIRMYRSVSLQVIQARAVRENGHSSAAHAYALATLAHLATSSPSSSVAPSSPDGVVHLSKRSASIASGSINSGEASSEDAYSHPSISAVALSPTTSVQPQPSPASPTAPTVQHSGKRPDSSSGGKEKISKDEGRQIFCEIWYEDNVLGRTGVKKLGSNTIWEEVFHFSNFGPFNSPLILHIYGVRKSQISLIGQVTVPLPSIRRNTAIEDWYEVAPPEQITKHGHFDSVGEVSLGVHVKEDIALPFKSYSRLGQVLSSDSDSTLVLSLLDNLHLELDLFAQVLLRIDVAHRRVLHRIMGLCEKEVEQNDSNLGTLFRGNSLLTKTVELYMRLIAFDYLDNSVGHVLRHICEERIVVEIDPARMEPKDHLQRNVEELEKWTRAIWESIYNSRQRCPIELRRVFRKIQQIVEQHCTDQKVTGRISEEEWNRIKFTSVSAFICLRLICPAILRPNLFRLCPTHPPDANTSRTLTLIAKVLMGMANLQPFGSKEPWMASMNPFLQEHLSSYQDFITYICSKTEGQRSDWTEKDFDLYSIPNLKRVTLLPDIVQEGVPELPFLIDLPKEYGAFASLVACAESDHQNYPGKGTTEKTEKCSSTLTELISTCQELYNQTRSRVRALERIGDLGRAGSSVNIARPLARSEHARLHGFRGRGQTISRTHYTSSGEPIGTPSRPSTGSVDDSRALLFASSPASHGPLSHIASGDLSASIATTSDLSSDTSHGTLSGRGKRRSHTVSGSPSVTGFVSLSPTAQAALLKALPIPPTSEEQEQASVTDSGLPSAPNSPGPPGSDTEARKGINTSPRRLTIGSHAAKPVPLQISGRSPGAHTQPEAKTPRAPTFTREQIEDLRDLQQQLAASAIHSPTSPTLGRGDTSGDALKASSPSSSPLRNKLFRRK